MVSPYVENGNFAAKENTAVNVNPMSSMAYIESASPLTLRWDTMLAIWGTL